MPRPVCSACHHPKPGKLASAYWAWFDENAERHAYKGWYCIDDVMAQVQLHVDTEPLLFDETATRICAACGIDATDDWRELFLTLYLPKKEPFEASIALCPSCFEIRSNELTENCVHLANRQFSDRREDSMLAWEKLGITPRGDAA